MTFDWRAHDLSEGHRIPSSGTRSLELILRARGTGTPVLFVHGATFSGRIFDIPHSNLNWLIAAAIRADSADELIGIRDFLDSRIGRHFADDVVGALQCGAADTETAITSVIRKWQGWRISRQIQRDDGIPTGLPYLTGWVQHFAITAAVEDAD
jgi:hypothetical protein